MKIKKNTSTEIVFTGVLNGGMFDSISTPAEKAKCNVSLVGVTVTVKGTESQIKKFVQEYNNYNQ